MASDYSSTTFVREWYLSDSVQPANGNQCPYRLKAHPSSYKNNENDGFTHLLYIYLITRQLLTRSSSLFCFHKRVCHFWKWRRWDTKEAFSSQSSSSPSFFLHAHLLTLLLQNVSRSRSIYNVFSILGSSYIYDDSSFVFLAFFWLGEREDMKAMKKVLMLYVQLYHILRVEKHNDYWATFWAEWTLA